VTQVLLKHNTKLHYIITIIARVHTYTWLHKEYHIQLTTEGQSLYISPN